MASTSHPRRFFASAQLWGFTKKLPIGIIHHWLKNHKHLGGIYIMTKKRKLKLEDLKVTSFVTDAEGQNAKGGTGLTVLGEACCVIDSTPEATCTTPQVTMEASCNGTCDASCNGTCNDSGERTCLPLLPTEGNYTNPPYMYCCFAG